MSSKLRLCRCSLIFLISVLPVSSEGVTSAGREFIFTIGDNRPIPQPVLFINLWDWDDIKNTVCNLTFFTGDNRTEHPVVVENSNYTLVWAPRETVVSYSSKNPESTIAKRSIYVRCRDKVTIVAYSNAIFSADSMLALPTDALGTEYIIPAHNHTFKFEPITAYLMVTAACEGLTAVNITFRQTVNFPNPIDGQMTNGVSTSAVLKKFETLTVLANDDITGAMVSTSCECAVISGNKRAQVGEMKSSDTLLEMIYPVNFWAREFLVAPLLGRTDGDVFRLIGGYRNTSCTISRYNTSELISETTEMFNPRDSIRFNNPFDIFVHVVCDQPAMLVQYAKSVGNSNVIGDPFMMLVPGRVHFDNKYVQTLLPQLDSETPFVSFVSLLILTVEFGSGFYVDQLNLADLSGGNQSVDNITVERHTTFADENWTSLTISAPGGRYSFYHNNPSVTFSATVYGLRKSESYGHPAGFRFTNTGDYCNTTKDSLNDGRDSDCDWLIDEEQYDGLDDDDDGLIDEDAAANEFFTPIEKTTKPNLPGTGMSEETGSKESQEGSRKISYSWFIILMAVMGAAAFITLLLALLIWYHKNTKQGKEASLEMQKRITPTRISIRGVWNGFKAKTVPS